MRDRFERLEHLERLQKTKPVKSLEVYVSLVERLRVNGKGPLWYRGRGKVSDELKPHFTGTKDQRA